MLKKHWGSIAAIVGPLVAFLTPSIHVYLKAHSTTDMGIVIAALLAAYNSKSPGDPRKGQ